MWHRCKESFLASEPLEGVVLRLTISATKSGEVDREFQKVELSVGVQNLDGHLGHVFQSLKRHFREIAC